MSILASDINTINKKPRLKRCFVWGEYLPLNTYFQNKSDDDFICPSKPLNLRFKPVFVTQ